MDASDAKDGRGAFLDEPLAHGVGHYRLLFRRRDRNEAHIRAGHGLANRLCVVARNSPDCIGASRAAWRQVQRALDDM